MYWLTPGLQYFASNATEILLHLMARDGCWSCLSFINRFNKRDLTSERNCCQVGMSVSKLGQLVFFQLQSLVVICFVKQKAAEILYITGNFFIILLSSPVLLSFSLSSLISVEFCMYRECSKKCPPACKASN